MMRFRKKPIVIDAWKLPCFELADPVGEWTKTIPDWLVEAECSGRVRAVNRNESDWAHLEIETLEGVMSAEPGDWIIRGIKGEIYPCKPDIFQATYEPA